MDTVTTVKIILKSLAEAKKFVSIASRYPMEMDLRYSRYVVDAKSILGIISLGAKDVLSLDIYGNVPEGFLEEIGPFIVTEYEG